MRIAKIPAEVVEQRVLESLRRRADPVTRRVYPSWKLMMREIGVCRQRIADAINNLKAKGQISVLTIPPPEGSKRSSEYFYELIVGLGDLWGQTLSINGDRPFNGQPCRTCRNV